MVKILISGSVGSGKTTIAQELARQLNYEIIHLNELAQKYKLKDVKELQTFDFDLDQLLEDFEKELKNKKNVIVEGHFSHFINPELVDVLFIINRDLKDLKKEYILRKYNEDKIKDNLEVESFNLCFYEAEEQGFNILGEKEEGNANVFCFDNDKSLQNLVEKVLRKLDKLGLVKNGS